MDNRTTKEIIRDNLLKYQGENGLSVQEFADKIGVSRNSLGFWLRADRTPSAENLADIRKATGISIDYLLGLAPSPASDPAIREICEYTGLSPESVKALHNITNGGSYLFAEEEANKTQSFINRVFCHVRHQYEWRKGLIEKWPAEARNKHKEERLLCIENIFALCENWITCQISQKEEIDERYNLPVKKILQGVIEKEIVSELEHIAIDTDGMQEPFGGE